MSNSHSILSQHKIVLILHNAQNFGGSSRIHVKCLQFVDFAKSLFSLDPFALVQSPPKDAPGQKALDGQLDHRRIRVTPRRSDSAWRQAGSRRFEERMMIVVRTLTHCDEAGSRNKASAMVSCCTSAERDCPLDQWRARSGILCRTLETISERSIARGHLPLREQPIY